MENPLKNPFLRVQSSERENKVRERQNNNLKNKTQRHWKCWIFPAPTHTVLPVYLFICLDKLNNYNTITHIWFNTKCKQIDTRRYIIDYEREIAENIRPGINTQLHTFLRIFCVMRVFILFNFILYKCFLSDPLNPEMCQSPSVGLLVQR